MLFQLLIAIASGGLAFFAFNWWSVRKEMGTQTFTQQAQAQIADARHKDEKLSPKDKLKAYAATKGYQGDIMPLLVAIGFIYLLTAVGLRFLGVGGFIGALAALPASFGVALITITRIAAKRRQKFRHQLANALTLLASQIESGSGPQRALELILPSLEDPLGSEFAAALDSTVASKDLVGAMKELASRFPSRAFDMFIAALEIDQAQGGSLAPALRQASRILTREFELTEETLAEISQTKAEFYAIVGIIGFISASMWAGSGEMGQKAYTSPIGIITIAIFGSNFGFGIFRVLRLINKAKGEV